MPGNSDKKGELYQLLPVAFILSVIYADYEKSKGSQNLKKLNKTEQNLKCDSWKLIRFRLHSYFQCVWGSMVNKENLSPDTEFLERKRGMGSQNEHGARGAEGEAKFSAAVG